MPPFWHGLLLQIPWLTGACVDVVCSVSHVRPANPRGHWHLNGIGSPIKSTHVPPFRHGLQLQTPWLADAVCVGACVDIVVDDDDDGGDGGGVVTDGGGVVIDGFVDGAFVVENSFVVDGGGVNLTGVCVVVVVAAAADAFVFGINLLIIIKIFSLVFYI